MRVFISHSSWDAQVARQLARRLSDAGLTVWLPEDEILPGDNWAKQVGKALEESDLMVVLVTPHSFRSEWQKQEIQYALTAKQYQGRLIAVFLGAQSEASPDVPGILRKLNPLQIGGSEEEDWQKVINKVRSVAQ